MITIWKFELAVRDRQTIQMPVGAEILLVATQNQVPGDDGSEGPCIWAKVDTDRPPEARVIRMVGTGHVCDQSAGEHLGSFQLAQGSFVGHVFGRRS